MLLGGLFQSIGTPTNLSQVQHPSKNAMLLRDQKRWAELYGVELRVPRPGGYARSVDALRATLLVDQAHRAAVIHRIYRAYWVEHLDIGDRSVLERLLTEAGVHGAQVLAAIDDKAKDELRANTDEAKARGAFGAPSIFYNGELFYGQDRLPLLEQRLGGTARWPGEGAFTQTQTTPRVVEFFYDASSPFAYLAARALTAVAQRTQAQVIWRPFLLGGLFKLLGGPMIPIETFSDNKRAFTRADLDRWAAHWGVPFVWSSRFPVRTLKAQRLAIALDLDGRAQLSVSDEAHSAQQSAAVATYALACFAAVWEHDQDLEDDNVLARCLVAAGKDASYLSRADDPTVKQALLAATEQTLSAGFFGAPGFRVGGEIFWGQDRLCLVERMLEGWTPSP